MRIEITTEALGVEELRVALQVLEQVVCELYDEYARRAQPEDIEILADTPPAPWLEEPE